MIGIEHRNPFGQYHEVLEHKMLRAVENRVVPDVCSLAYLEVSRALEQRVPSDARPAAKAQAPVEERHSHAVGEADVVRQLKHVVTIGAELDDGASPEVDVLPDAHTDEWSAAKPHGRRQAPRRGVEGRHGLKAGAVRRVDDQPGAAPASLGLRPQHPQLEARPLQREPEKAKVAPEAGFHAARIAETVRVAAAASHWGVRAASIPRVSVRNFLAALRLLTGMEADDRLALKAVASLVGREYVVARRCSTIDPDATLSPLASLRFTERVSVGPRANIGPYACVWGGWSTAWARVGADAMLSPGATLVAGNHLLDGVGPVRTLGFDEQDVSVGAGAWIGAHAVVIGAHVGEGAVVGANAVVLEDVAAHAIVAGAPARVVGHRPS